MNMNMNMNNPFNFKNIGVITNVASSITSNVASNKPLQNFDENFIKSWVSNLNTKIDDNRLLFEYYADKDNPSIFYVILKIDSNKTNNKVLNIFRAESYNNIIWQYDLNNEFMNNIYKKGKSYFYDVMKNYYEVVEKQMEMYLYYLKNKISLSEMMNIIFIYNFFIKNNIWKNIINHFIYFIKNIKIKETNIYNINNKIYLYFMSLTLINAIEKNGKQIKKEKNIERNEKQKNNQQNEKQKNNQQIDSFIFSIDYGLQFYFYICCIDRSFFKNEFIDKLTSVDDLKNSIFYGKVQDFFNDEYLKARIESEFVRGVSIKVNNILLEEKQINNSEKIRNVLNNNIEKLVILKSFIDSGARFSNTSQISYLLIGGNDTYLYRDRQNKPSYINLNINNRKAVTVLEQQIIKIDTGNEISYLMSSLNIDLKNNKITTTYEFEGFDKDFLLSNLRKYDIYPTIIEQENSNSTYEIIEYNTSFKPEKTYPKILVFNFDEKCEELLTDSFYVSKEKREKKQIQQGIIDDFITEVKTIKPAIVVVCTRNSISKTDKHYQHSIKDKIRDLNNNNEVNYFPLLKVDSTLESNVHSVKLIGKTLCGLRTRVYVDQNQLYFKYREKYYKKSYFGKGNELENFYEQNNSVIRVLSPSNNNKNKNTFSNRKTSTSQIGSIIKYGAKRITNPNDKNKGAITINLVLKLDNDDIKKQFIFCNYLDENNNVSNFIANNNKNKNSIIPKDKNIYICFLTNKKSNENI